MTTTVDAAAPITFGSAWRMLRPVHRHLVSCAVLSAVGAAAGLAPFVAVAEIGRAVLAAPAPAAVAPTVWVWVAVGAAGAVLRQVLDGLSSHVGHHADAVMQQSLREQVVARLARVPMGWFAARGSAQVKKAMTDDLDDMHNLFAHSLGELTSSTAATLAAFAYLVTVDVPMALVTVAVPALILLNYRLSMRSMPLHVARLLAAEARTSGTAVDVVDGIAEAKTFGAGRWALARVETALDEHRSAFAAWVREIRGSLAVGAVLASEVTSAAAVLGVGAVALGAGALTGAELLPFLVLGIGLPSVVHRLISGTVGLRTARVAGGHLERLLAQRPLPEPVAPRSPAGRTVEFDDVRFSYDGSTEALAGITATCRPGTVTALVGPSGAGKSTLAALLPRFHDVTGGAVRIGGVDVREIATPELLSSLALVFQDVVLLRDTVAANIRAGRADATDEDVRRAAKAAHVHDVVEALPQGYDTVLGASAGGLSGGQQQRLTIARAILSDAPVVVLDEATAALDPDSEAAVQDALAELTAGRTVIVIAHRLHAVRDADQILVLDGGRVVEHGTHDRLVAAGGRYTRMWAAQNEATQNQDIQNQATHDDGSDR